MSEHETICALCDGPLARKDALRVPAPTDHANPVSDDRPVCPACVDALAAERTR